MNKNTFKGLALIAVMVITLVVGFGAPVETMAQSFSIVPSDCINKTGGCNICEVTKIFTNAANIMSFALSSLALIMFIIGGFLLILSAGNEQRIEAGRKILVGTVTGIGIVFMAWFLVNFIVRTAYYSSDQATEYTPYIGDAADDPVNVFGSQWWSQPECIVPVTTCAGATIGASCRTASCSDSDSCQCIRKVDEEGDDGTCEGDGSISEATSDAGIEDKNCACMSACEVNAIVDGKDYTCVNASDVDEDATQKGYGCNQEGFVCVEE